MNNWKYPPPPSSPREFFRQSFIYQWNDVFCRLWAVIFANQPLLGTIQPAVECWLDGLRSCFPHPCAVCPRGNGWCNLPSPLLASYRTPHRPNHDPPPPNKPASHQPTPPASAAAFLGDVAAEDRLPHLTALVAECVELATGRRAAPQDALMDAGMDSLAGAGHKGGVWGGLSS